MDVIPYFQNPHLQTHINRKKDEALLRKGYSKREAQDEEKPNSCKKTQIILGVNKPEVSRQESCGRYPQPAQSTGGPSQPLPMLVILKSILEKHASGVAFFLG